MTIIYSNLSNIVTASKLTPKKAYLKVPNDPEQNRSVQCDPKLDPKKPIQSGTFYPSGAENAVIIKAEQVATGWEFDLMVRAYSKAEHDALVDMLTGSDTVLWQDVLPRQIYCQTTEDLSTSRLHAAPSNTSDPVGWVYEITSHMVEVARPEV